MTVRVVHLSDLHLGFRQYQRLTSVGANQREADVALTFRRTVDRVIALDPDLVVIAGDVFHSVRPSNPAILYAFQQFSRLTAELPGVPVVMVAGNHDLPRSAETSCILRLFEESLGIHVADFAARRLPFPDRKLSVLAVPDVAGEQQYELDPDPAARYNVLVLHGEHPDVQPGGASIDRARLVVNAEHLHPEQWSYVALGHYHVHHRIADNAYYSGSIDYTSTSAWTELAEERAAGLPGKGFIEFDLETGVHTFHPIPPSRVLAELPPFSARGMTGHEVDAAIQEAVNGCPGGIDGKIVRLVVHEVPRHINSDLDQTMIRQFRRRAFHFQLELLRPEVRPLRGSGAPGHPQSMTEFVRERLLTRTIPADVDRDQLIEKVFSYLDEAAAAELAAGEEAPA